MKQPRVASAKANRVTLNMLLTFMLLFTGGAVEGRSSPWGQSLPPQPDAAFALLIPGGTQVTVAQSRIPVPAASSAPQHTIVAQQGVTAIAAGGAHTCALTSGGGVKCWGSNSGGELGDGSTTARYTPVDVSGLTSGVIEIAAGGGHTCALISNGSVKCWGGNSNGQLGDGTSENIRTTPVNVIGLTNGVVAIAAGGSYTCALTSSGGVKCWGDGNEGQIGDGRNFLEGPTPVDVIGLTRGVTAIVAGGSHTCALTNVGGVKCWGADNSGQLGDGTTVRFHNTPVNVSGLTSNVIALTAGGATCALTSSGGVKCWGRNSSGQVGDGTTTDRYTPVDVSGLTSDVTALAAGGAHTCALSNAGGAKCWEYNSNGQLGDGTNTDRTTPVNVSGLTSGVIEIAAGGGHTCALTGGGVKCWGHNYAGQLGDGTTADRLTPVDVVGLGGIDSGRFPTPTVSPTPISIGKSPLQQGLIAYIGSDRNLWTIKADGSENTRRTDWGTAADPTWSPDGNLLASLRYYGGDVDAPLRTSLWILNPATSEQRQLTDNILGWYDWSLDSRLIVFDRRFPEGTDLCLNRASPLYEGLWQVDVQMGEARSLVPQQNGYPLLRPVWSPNDHLLSFVEQTYCEGSGPFAYWRVGDAQYTVTGDVLGSYDWSPDGQWLVYDGIGYVGGAPNLWLRTADGRQVMPLPGTPGTFDLIPKWSPDGRQIAFLRGDGETSNYLWVMNADGSDQHQITSFPVNNFVWSPEGSQLAASSEDGGFYVLNLDGSNAQWIAEGYLGDWQPTPSVDLTTLIADKQQLINSLSNLSVDFLGVQSVKLPSFKSYDESQALALLDELSAQSQVSTLTQTQADNFERLVLFERALYEFYRLDARAADDTGRSLAGVISVGWQWIKTLDTIQDILKSAPLGDIINRLLQRAKEKALDIIHSYVQFLVGLVPDPDLREGLQIAAWEIFEVLKVGASEGRSVLEVLRDGAVIIAGDELLVAQYVTRTQPALDQAVINARNEVGPGGTAAVAEARLQSLLDEERKWADHAHDSFKLADEVADTASVVGNMADIATVVTSPSGAGPAIAQLVSLFAKSVGATAYITGGGLNAWVWYRIPGAVANAPVAALDPNAQPSGSTPPAEAKLILAAYRPETAEYLTRQEAQLQQASADYEQLLAQVVRVAQQGDEHSLSELIPQLLAADEILSQQSFVSATPVMMSPNVSVEQKAALYTARVAFNTETATLYGLLVKILVEPANTDAQAQTVQQAQTALSAITAYVNLIGETGGQIANEVLPPQVVVTATNVPEAITPGQPFDLTITLANASPSSASNISMHILGEEGHAIDQTIPLGEIVGGGQVTTTVSLQVNQGGAAILRVDALEGDTIADSRLVILDVVETTPDKASVASVASERNNFWSALTIFAIGLIVFVFGLVNLFKSRRR